MPEPTARHHALAAEAVTGGPMLERDIVARVASLLAHREALVTDAAQRGHFERVQGYCPMGCGTALFVAEGGHITCSWVDCPNPSAVDELLADRETEHVVTIGTYGYNLKHPLRGRIGDALLDCTVGEWIGAQGPADLPTPGRYRAVEPVGDTVWERLP